MSVRKILSCGFAVALIAVGCGQSDFQQRLSKLESDTKSQHKATDIQAAMTPFFADEHILTNQLPKEITSLPIFADDPTNITLLTTESTNVLMLIIGGGFGHWGIIVARPGHDQEISSWHRKRVTPWADGVYFFCE